MPWGDGRVGGATGIGLWFLGKEPDEGNCKDGTRTVFFIGPVSEEKKRFSAGGPQDNSKRRKINSKEWDKADGIENEGNESKTFEEID